MAFRRPTPHVFATTRRKCRSREPIEPLLALTVRRSISLPTSSHVTGPKQTPGGEEGGVVALSPCGRRVWTTPTVGVSFRQLWLPLAQKCQKGALPQELPPSLGSSSSLGRKGTGANTIYVLLQSIDLCSILSILSILST